MTELGFPFGAWDLPTIGFLFIIISIGVGLSQYILVVYQGQAGPGSNLRSETKDLLILSVNPADEFGFIDNKNLKLLDHLVWGTVRPANNYSRQVFLYNNGTDFFPYVWMNYGNFVPELAGQYIAVEWDYPYQKPMFSGQVLPINLKLVVAEKVSGVTDFSFDIAFDIGGKE